MSNWNVGPLNIRDWVVGSTNIPCVLLWLSCSGCLSWPTVVVVVVVSSSGGQYIGYTFCGNPCCQIKFKLTYFAVVFTHGVCLDDIHLWLFCGVVSLWKVMGVMCRWGEDSWRLIRREGQGVPHGTGDGTSGEQGRGAIRNYRTTGEVDWSADGGERATTRRTKSLGR